MAVDKASRDGGAEGRGSYGYSYMCDISHDIFRVVFSKSFFSYFFCEFRLPRNWIKQPEMTNERTESGRACCQQGGWYMCVCVYVCCTCAPVIFHLWTFPFCAERCRFSRFRRASNIDEAAADPAAAWQPDRANNNNIQNWLTSSACMTLCVCVLLVCLCEGVNLQKKNIRKFALSKNRSLKINGRQMPSRCCMLCPCPVCLCSLYVCVPKIWKWLPSAHMCVWVCVCVIRYFSDLCHNACKSIKCEYAKDGSQPHRIRSTRLFVMGSQTHFNFICDALRTNTQTERQTDRRTGGRTDGLTDRQTDRLTRRKMVGSAGGGGRAYQSQINEMWVPQLLPAPTFGCQFDGFFVVVGCQLDASFYVGILVFYFASCAFRADQTNFAHFGMPRMQMPFLSQNYTIHHISFDLTWVKQQSKRPLHPRRLLQQLNLILILAPVTNVFPIRSSRNCQLKLLMGFCEETDSKPCELLAKQLLHF